MVQHFAVADIVMPLFKKEAKKVRKMRNNFDALN